MSAAIEQAVAMSEGAGARVRRLFPARAERMNFDPFVLWDHFTLRDGGGFPRHPHRGFEAITYLFRGNMEHADNLGNVSTVGPGGAQRFTAGRGLEHSEMPGGDEEISGIQLWVNLPRRLKGIDPDYQGVQADEIPQVNEQGVTRRIIVGERGPVKLHTPVRYEELRLEAGSSVEEEVPGGWHGIVYVVEGTVDISGEQAGAGAAWLGGEGSITIGAGAPAVVMLCLGRSHGEPIRQWGPYVD